MKDTKFFKKYFYQQFLIINDKPNIIDDIQKILKLIKKLRKNNKILIFGNGGSSAIASHFTTDIVKNLKIKCLNFNDNSLVTCFSNDYEYENSIKHYLERFFDKGDLVIFISSSGESKNMINGIKFLSKKGIKNTVTLTGFKKNNPLNKKGKINIWVDSKVYNHVENAHQIILLSLIDYLISKR